MKFIETALNGVFIIEPEPAGDERGFFARTWCREEFQRYQLNTTIAQCSLSFNKKKGTLRGMHYQVEPFRETKVIRCTRGAIYDVAVDLRRDSPSFGQWVGMELTAGNHKMVYIPEGLAHGFISLEDNTEVHYQISQVYSVQHACGVRWDDPMFDIKWPPGEKILSERDRNWPLFHADAPGNSP